MPVLPLVGSTIVAPGRSAPRRSASSIIATAIRSLTLPPGLKNSSFASTTAPPARDGVRDLLPELGQLVGVAVRAAPVRAKRSQRGLLSFHRPQDLAHGDLL